MSDLNTQNKKLKKFYKKVFFKLVNDKTLAWDYKWSSEGYGDYKNIYTSSEACGVSFKFYSGGEDPHSGVYIYINGSQVCKLDGFLIQWYRIKIKNQIRQIRKEAEMLGEIRSLEEKSQCLKILTDDN